MVKAVVIVVLVLLVLRLVVGAVRSRTLRGSDRTGGVRGRKLALNRAECQGKRQGRVPGHVRGGSRDERPAGRQEEVGR